MPELSVSTAPYDGYELPKALESLARLGVARVGLTPLGGEGEAFAPAGMRRSASALRDAGLACHALLAETGVAGADGLPGVDELLRLIDYARGVGARVLCLPAPARRDRRRALAQLAALDARLEAAELTLVLTPALDAGAQGLPDAADFVAAVGLPRVALGFSTLHAALTQPGLGLAAQFDAVGAASRHLLLADVREQDGWFCQPPGEGSAGCEQLLARLRQRPMPCTIHLPLRLHQTRRGITRRAPYRVPMDDIEAALARSLSFVNSFY